MDCFDNKDLVVRAHEIFCEEVCMCVASKKLNWKLLYGRYYWISNECAWIYIFIIPSFYFITFFIINIVNIYHHINIQWLQKLFIILIISHFN